jgi:hypothetical protein
MTRPFGLRRRTVISDGPDRDLVTVPDPSYRVSGADSKLPSAAALAFADVCLAVRNYRPIPAR